MEPPHENHYEMVKNPVYGNNTVARGDTSSSNVASESKRLHNNSSNKVLVALIVATCFSVLLALCSLAIAIFVLVNQRFLMASNSAQMQVLGDTPAINLTNMVQTEFNTLAQDLKSELRNLSKDLTHTNSKIRSLSEKANITRMEVSQDLNFELRNLSEDLTHTKSVIRSLSEKANITRMEVSLLKEDTNVTQSRVKVLSEDVSGLSFAQSSFNQIVIEINRTMDEVVTGPPGKDASYKLVTYKGCELIEM